MTCRTLLAAALSAALLPIALAAQRPATAPDTGPSGTPREDPAESFAALLAVAVRAAVVAPEPELRRWFSWQWYWTDTLIDDLVGDGRLRRLDGYLTVGVQA